MFVYRATKKAADVAEKTVNLTEKSLDLNTKIQEFQFSESERQREGLRMQYVYSLYEKSGEILKAVTSMNVEYIHNSLRVIDTDHGIKPETLAFCISIEELRVINKAWNALGYYINRYHGDVNQGSNINLLVTYAYIPITEFEKLKNARVDTFCVMVRHEQNKRRLRALPTYTTNCR